MIVTFSIKIKGYVFLPKSIMVNDDSGTNVQVYFPSWINSDK